jgi:hypothetical protein
MLRRAGSLILAAALSSFTACEKQSNANAAPRMTDANRQNSAEELVVIGLLAAMKLWECINSSLSHAALGCATPPYNLNVQLASQG